MLRVLQHQWPRPPRQHGCRAARVATDDVVPGHGEHRALVRDEHTQRRPRLLCRPAPRSSGAPQDAQVAASGSLKCALRQLTPSTISTSPGRGGAGVPDGAVPTGSGARRPAVGPAADLPRAARCEKAPPTAAPSGSWSPPAPADAPVPPGWLSAVVARVPRSPARVSTSPARASTFPARVPTSPARTPARAPASRPAYRGGRRRLQGHAPTGHRALPEVERHRRRSVCGGSTRAGDRDRVVRRVDPALQPGQGLRGVEGLGLRAVDAHRDVAVDQDEAASRRPGAAARSRAPPRALPR